MPEKYPLPKWYSKWMAHPRYPKEWPHGARIAVCVHVPFEVWTERPLTSHSGRSLLRAKQSTGHPIPHDARFKYDAITMSEHDFGGRVGVRRMLDLLDSYNIKGSFPVTGAATIRYRDVVKAIYRNGHEILGRGFYQEESAIFMTPREERSDIKRSTESLLEVADEVGAKRDQQGPLGFVPNLGQWTSATDDIILGLGYIYVTAVSNDDRPYAIDYKGKSLANVPLPNFTGAAQDGAITWGGYTPQDLYGVFKDEFDYWYEQGEEGNPGLVTMICHPYVGGRAHIVKNWERMIRYAKRHNKVWFAKRVDIAKWILKNAHHS